MARGLVATPTAVKGRRQLPMDRSRSIRGKVPNILSVSRLVMAGVVMLLLAESHARTGWDVGAVFGLAGVTDFFDGRMARHWGVVSAFGRLVDPLADKVLIGSAVALLVAYGRLPLIAVPMLLGRQLVLWPLRFAFRGRVAFPASRLGKLSAMVIYIALAIILTTYRDVEWPVWVFFAGAGLALSEIGLYASSVARYWATRRDTPVVSESPDEESACNAA